MNTLDKGAQILGINLNREQLEQFEIYYRELVEWNRGINLTSITDYEEVQVKHFLDSLSIIPYLKITRDGFRVIDIGAGAGLPGVPLKIVRPEIKLMLLEATGKKTQFLTYLIDRLGMSDVEVVNGRAEEIAHERRHREQYDAALARAVATLPAAVELALPFCVPGGVFIAQKKGNIEREISQSMRAIDEMGGRLREIKKVQIEGILEGRKLIVIEKIRATPGKYPRRSGIPAKRPIT
jgi:16S rRNA (guanine527-N7)-methyltransferase